MCGPLNINRPTPSSTVTSLNQVDHDNTHCLDQISGSQLNKARPSFQATSFGTTVFIPLGNANKNVSRSDNGDLFGNFCLPPPALPDTSQLLEIGSVSNLNMNTDIGLVTLPVQQSYSANSYTMGSTVNNYYEPMTYGNDNSRYQFNNEDNPANDNRPTCNCGTQDGNFI